MIGREEQYTNMIGMRGYSMKYFTDGNLIIKSWCNDVEDGAKEQAINLANLPFAFKQICLMPDTHQGYGMPIGGVLATEGYVIPNAVGVDIGCGMCAVRTTQMSLINLDKLKTIMGKIRNAVPVGFKHHLKPQSIDLMPDPECGVIIPDPVIQYEFKSATHQLGTLGGGNHFIEIQQDPDGFLWIMIHSGSRNLGKKVADHYNKLAKMLNTRWHSSVPKEWDLAFLPSDTSEYNWYMAEMQYCVDFALANRYLIMSRIMEIFSDETNCEFGNITNIAHNYARMEHHFGKNVLVHRKGATSAREGEVGIIPGSQGTASYIVEGLGNPDSFYSCSHGAGRIMGRKEAIRTLNLKEEVKKLDDKGILHGIRGTDDLDEASGAYKDIDIVMREQSDLVKILVELKPMAVIKG